MQNFNIFAGLCKLAHLFRVLLGQKFRGQVSEGVQKQNYCPV